MMPSSVTLIAIIGMILAHGGGNNHNAEIPGALRSVANNLEDVTWSCSRSTGGQVRQQTSSGNSKEHHTASRTTRSIPLRVADNLVALRKDVIDPEASGETTIAMVNIMQHYDQSDSNVHGQKRRGRQIDAATLARIPHPCPKNGLQKIMNGLYKRSVRKSIGRKISRSKQL